MQDQNLVRNLVVELKNGLLEIEAHSSMLKKRIFELERHLADTPHNVNLPDAPSSPDSQPRIPICYDRLLPFGFRGPLRRVGEF